jgi:hypothetical protein
MLGKFFATLAAVFIGLGIAIAAVSPDQRAAWVQAKNAVLLGAAFLLVFLALSISARSR